MQIGKHIISPQSSKVKLIEALVHSTSVLAPRACETTMGRVDPKLLPVKNLKRLLVCALAPEYRSDVLNGS